VNLIHLPFPATGRTCSAATHPPAAQCLPNAAWLRFGCFLVHGGTVSVPCVAGRISAGGQDTSGAITTNRSTGGIFSLLPAFLLRLPAHLLTSVYNARGWTGWHQCLYLTWGRSAAVALRCAHCTITAYLEDLWALRAASAAWCGILKTTRALADAAAFPAPIRANAACAMRDLDAVARRGLALWQTCAVASARGTGDAMVGGRLFHSLLPAWRDMNDFLIMFKGKRWTTRAFCGGVFYGAGGVERKGGFAFCLGLFVLQAWRTGAVQPCALSTVETEKRCRCKTPAVILRACTWTSLFIQALSTPRRLCACVGVAVLPLSHSFPSSALIYLGVFFLICWQMHFRFVPGSLPFLLCPALCAWAGALLPALCWEQRCVSPVRGCRLPSREGGKAFDLLRGPRTTNCAAPAHRRLPRLRLRLPRCGGVLDILFLLSWRMLPGWAGLLACNKTTHVALSPKALRTAQSVSRACRSRPADSPPSVASLDTGRHNARNVSGCWARHSRMRRRGTWHWTADGGATMRRACGRLAWCGR